MHTLVLAVSLLVVYAALVVLYRLYFSPLAKFPGPKLAAATTWYNAYYDIVKGGKYVWVVEDMHRKYGPIVRTRPDAIHVNDVRFVDKLYSQSPKFRRERYRTVLQLVQAPGSILATKDHDLHRRRRAVLNPYFSHANVRRLEPVINATLGNLLHRMAGWAEQSRPVEMNLAFRAATKDVIQAYAFGDGERCLDMEDCNAAFFNVVIPEPFVHMGTYAGWFLKLMSSLPPHLTVLLIPRVAVFARFMQGLHAQIDEIRNAKEVPEGRTIFHEVIRSDIPESEKQTMRVGDEAMVMLLAGTDTTASTLAAVTYHLLADHQLLARLKRELESVMPDPDRFPVAAKLDGLPLLNAIIKEALRLYPGATHRQDRVAPDEDLVYERPDGTVFKIPAGTGIGMTAPLLNRHPDLYSDPDDFLPERYIDNPGLYKHLFTFSKGTRQCIGMELAYQELQTFTAGIFRKYDVYDPSKSTQGGPTIELYETTRDDIAMDADCVTPMQYPGSKGLRVRIRQ